MSRFQGMVRCEIKDAVVHSALHSAAHSAKRQERPLDLTVELARRQDLRNTARELRYRFLAETQPCEAGAIIFRQVLHTLLSLMSGQCTGIWQGLCVAEFNARVRNEEWGSDVVQISGKNRRKKRWVWQHRRL